MIAALVTPFVPENNPANFLIDPLPDLLNGQDGYQGSFQINLQEITQVAYQVQVSKLTSYHRC
jgi:hypothetical protein